MCDRPFSEGAGHAGTQLPFFSRRLKLVPCTPARQAVKRPGQGTPRLRVERVCCVGEGHFLAGFALQTQGGLVTLTK